MSTIEHLVAITILVFGISAGMMVVYQYQYLVTDTELTQEALYSAQLEVEKARFAARQDWDDLTTVSTRDGMFTQNLQVTDADDFLKVVTSQVSWQSPAGGQRREVEVSTILSDWLESKSLGSCDDDEVAAGDWANPVILAALDLGASNSSTDIDVRDGIAYVTANSSIQSKEDFFVVDVRSNPYPTVLKKLNTGPGLKAVHVAGRYAYVANTSINSQLQIIDISNPQGAYLRSAYKLPGVYTGSATVGISIYYYRSKVYVGTKKSPIAEFHIIDVSDPLNPQEVGTWEFGTSVNAIYLSNGKAYVATPDDEELKVLDITEPQDIKFLGGFNAPGGSGSGKSLARSGSHMFLGRTIGGSELHVLDVENISGGTVASRDIGSSINGLVVKGDLAFLATTDAGKEFQVLKGARDLTGFTPVANLNLAARATALDCEGQLLYLTSEDRSQSLVILGANP